MIIYQYILLGCTLKYKEKSISNINELISYIYKDLYDNELEN